MASLIPIQPKLTQLALPPLVTIRGQRVHTPASKHGLINLLAIAYATHSTLRITANDIYLTILTTFANHVNQSPATIEHYRSLLAAPSGAKTEVVVDIVDLVSTDDFTKWTATECTNIFDVFCQTLNATAVTPGMASLVLDLSNTTPVQRLNSQVALAHMVEAFYSMRLFCSCGFRGIYLDAIFEDWTKIQAKITYLQSIQHPDIANYLAGALDIVHNLQKGTVDWSDMFYSEECGSGGDDYKYSGWMLALLRIERLPSWKPSDAPSSRTQYLFNVDLAGDEKAILIDVGAVGVVSVNGVLQLAYDFYFEAPTPKGWTFEGRSTTESGLTWTAETYPKIRYCGNLLHEVPVKYPTKSNDIMLGVVVQTDGQLGFAFKRLCDNKPQTMVSRGQFYEGSYLCHCEVYKNEDITTWATMIYAYPTT